MTRYTSKMIEKRIENLNRSLNLPVESWQRIENKNIAQIGNIHLSAVYAGYQILQMVNEGGGCRFPFTDATMSLRECAYVLETVFKLIYAAKEKGHTLAV